MFSRLSSTILQLWFEFKGIVVFGAAEGEDSLEPPPLDGFPVAIDDRRRGSILGLSEQPEPPHHLSIRGKASLGFRREGAADGQLLLLED